MRVRELYRRKDTGLLATSCRLPGSSSTVEPSSAPRGTRHRVRSALGISAAESDEVRAGQTAADQQTCAGGADVGIIRRADRDGQIQIAILENQRDAGRTNAPSRRRRAGAGFRG